MAPASTGPNRRSMLDFAMRSTQPPERGLSHEDAIALKLRIDQRIGANNGDRPVSPAPIHDTNVQQSVLRFEQHANRDDRYGTDAGSFGDNATESEGFEQQPHIVDEFVGSEVSSDEDEGFLEYQKPRQQSPDRADALVEREAQLLKRQKQHLRTKFATNVSSYPSTSSAISETSFHVRDSAPPFAQISRPLETEATQIGDSNNRLQPVSMALSGVKPTDIALAHAPQPPNDGSSKTNQKSTAAQNQSFQRNGHTSTVRAARTTEPDRPPNTVPGRPPHPVISLHNAPFQDLESGLENRRSTNPPQTVYAMPVTHTCVTKSDHSYDAAGRNGGAMAEPIKLPEKSISGTPDLDYPPDVLAGLDFDDLKSRSFDFSPYDSRDGEVTDEETFTQKLVSALDGDKSDHSSFFSSLTIQQWEDAGDWFQDRFSNIMSQLKATRREKRKLALAFEQEVEQRYGAVTRKKHLTDSALEAMRASGGRVLNSTPKRR